MVTRTRQEGTFLLKGFVFLDKSWTCDFLASDRLSNRVHFLSTWLRLMKSHLISRDPSSNSKAENSIEHSKTHGDRRQTRCLKCLKLVANLSGHMRYCNNIRNVPCKLCSKMFTTKSEMLCHVTQTHLKERNFKCTLCPKSYTDPTPLRHHLNATHGDGSTFSHCSFCRKSFTTKRRFLEHNAKYHESKNK